MRVRNLLRRTAGTGDGARPGGARTIAFGGSLELLGSTPFRTPAASAFDARLAPDGATLWTVEDGARAVSGFAVAGGQLSELPSSPAPLPTNAASFGIVVG